jgi:hypothetical protein
MIKQNVIKMLHTMHQMGVKVDIQPDWDREEWCNAVIHQFNIHCMPYANETATETAQICYHNRYVLGQGKAWQTAWKRPTTRRVYSNYGSRR